MNETALTVGDFFGGRSGRAPGDEGQTIDLVTRQIGVLGIPSGVLGVVDPFASLDAPLDVQLERGSYPVILTLGSYPDEDDPEFTDAAYLSVVLADGDSVSVEPVPGTFVDGQLYGVTTWGGSVGFVDAQAAVGHTVPPESAVFDEWLNLAGADPQGLLDARLPWATRGENVIGIMSPNDEGQYPVYMTRDAGGRPLAVHVDFLVVGKGRYALDVSEWPPSS